MPVENKVKFVSVLNIFVNYTLERVYATLDIGKIVSPDRSYKKKGNIYRC